MKHKIVLIDSTKLNLLIHMNFTFKRCQIKKEKSRPFPLDLNFCNMQGFGANLEIFS